MGPGPQRAGRTVRHGRGNGSNRLRLDPKGERGVVAAWQRGAKGGVACYEIPTGKLIWHRGDLRQSQGISFSTDGQSVWFEPNEGRVERLDALSGNTIEYLTGVRHIHVNHHSSEIFIERWSGVYVLRGAKDFDIPKITFAILDVAFGPESLCLTESGGPVRCLDCRSGVERWRYESPKDNHVLRLWYRESDGHYYGVQWQYQTGGPRSFCALMLGPDRLRKSFNSIPGRRRFASVWTAWLPLPGKY